MRIILILIASLALAPAAIAEVYKWVDSNGKVHYGDTPPANARATPVDMTSSGPSRAGQVPATAAAEQASQPPAQPPIQISIAPETPAPQPATRGMDFGVYIMLRVGMSEGELLGIAGEPDLRRRSRATDIYTYLPTAADPFTTTITLVRGRVNEIDRDRKF